MFFLPSSPISTEPAAYQNWVANDDLTWAVVFMALDKSEYEGLDEAETIADLFDKVKIRAESEGPVCMVSLI